jgi:hypothetical protein
MLPRLQGTERAAGMKYIGLANLKQNCLIESIFVTEKFALFILLIPSHTRIRATL